MLGLLVFVEVRSMRERSFGWRSELQLMCQTFVRAAQVRSSRQCGLQSISLIRMDSCLHGNDEQRARKKP
jgi:hypothetical protein